MSRKITLNEYINSQDKPLYDENSVLAKEIPDFIKEDEFQAALTGVLSNLYGDYSIRKKYISSVPDYHVSDILIIHDILFVYVENAYKYQKLYDTLSLEYNPIENYNMVEDGRDDRTENIGSKNNTEDIGNRSDSATIGNKTDTNTRRESPYETESFRNKEEDTYVSGSQTNSSVIGAQHNKYTEGEQENKDNLIHHLERKGNIGTLTTQNMIESERNVANFSLYRIIATDIMKQICSGLLC